MGHRCNNQVYYWNTLCIRKHPSVHATQFFAPPPPPPAAPVRLLTIRRDHLRDCIYIYTGLVIQSWHRL